MKSAKAELYVGIFFVIGVSCSLFLIFTLGEFKIFTNDRYKIYAYFTSVSGLTKGASVEMAGVSIGEVTGISLDNDRLLAKVTLAFDKKIKLSEDVVASVKTSGIIGDKYIDISPGGSDVILENEDIIYNTESAVDLETLVRKYIFSAKED